MTDEFKQFLRSFLYPHECEYIRGHYGDLNYVNWENVPGDDGKWTKWGIDYTSHKSLGVDGIKNLTIDQADAIYWSEFVQGGCDKLEDPLCWAYFDTQVNAGPGRAKQLLRLTHDAKEYTKARIAWYERLISARPSFAKFRKGWEQRCYDLNAYLKL